MAKKAAKKAAPKRAAKTTTRRPKARVTAAQSRASVNTAKTAFSGRGTARRVTPGAGETARFNQEKVRLFTGGKTNKPTMMAAKGSKQTFTDRNGKKVSKTKAARKDGTMRSGFTMTTQGPGGRNKEFVTGGSTE